jgi:hypothetical protein
MIGRNRRREGVSLSLVALLLSISFIFTAETPPPGVDGIYFADSWEANEIIIPDGAMDPPSKTIPDKLYVVLSSGQRCSVEFLKKIETKVTEIDPHTHYTCTGGSVFAFKKEYCGDYWWVLASEEFLKKHVPIAVSKGTMEPLGKKNVRRIEKAKKRVVHKSWDIASTGNGITFALVQFTDPEKVPSSCLVLITKKKLVFEDFGKDYGSIVIDDDEARTSKEDSFIETPDFVEILNVFKSSSGLEIVRLLQGQEGTNTDLLRENGASFKMMQRNYFYWPH